MPISRDEFETGQISRDRRILQLLNSFRDRAFSKEDLLAALNSRGPIETARGPHEVLEALGDQVPTDTEQLEAALERLLSENLIRSAVLEGRLYYMAGIGGYRL